MSLRRSEASWSGSGAGTDRDSFIAAVHGLLPELDAEQAAEGVFCVLSQRLSGGTARRLLDELPEDARGLFRHCERHANSPAPEGNRDDFYLAVSNHLNIEPEDVRRILHAVYGAIHSQITEAESERIASELPRDLSDTWLGARHGIPAPH
jgi:uncharacterized protein (DUF2267 family)